eukprot:COSAG02_NODE_1194_length_13955_cov_7.341055_9_plen_344_part_00
MEKSLGTAGGRTRFDTSLEHWHSKLLGETWRRRGAPPKRCRAHPMAAPDGSPQWPLSRRRRSRKCSRTALRVHRRWWAPLSVELLPVAAEPTSTVQEVLADGTTSASQAVGAALADSVELLPVAAEPKSTVQEVLADGTTSASQAVGAALADSVELLPSNVQEDVAEPRRKPCEMLMRACWWLLVATAYALCYGVCYGVYFGRGRLQCGGTVYDFSRHTLAEISIGAGPFLLRLVQSLAKDVVMKLCRKVTGARGDGVGLYEALCILPSAAGDEDIVRRAGWERIVGRSGAQAEPLFWLFTGGEDKDGGGDDDGADDVAPPPQSTWEQAREARKLTHNQVSRE